MKSIGREEEREGWKMEWRKTERDGGWDGEGESWGSPISLQQKLVGGLYRSRLVGGL